ncbi:fimbria/pilus periplasmic chaperone [Luteibacter flocculans]|uniref:Fimbria/pilus periplasmic chaperone n=1 Tax=Luteibacter flocculans TaxID=2780091 RepID=A0ABY4SZ07_9GAMM|nr:fimbria/pilus periplasmic chaperone [Luteibacter flocculans]URL57932.1 fimbria/pilus periplasmic chaperone [Luteibacter flocculans]
MFRAISALCAVTLFVLAQPVLGAVVIGGTRVVFPAQARDVSLKIQNKGSDPALVQVWIDDGDEASSPSNARAPFAITPPMFRIDPGQGHALRIVHVGDSAPRDRETLYWLNVLEIPPKAPEAEGKNVLQFAFRHRLKLFHRPAGLKSPPESAASMLRWTMDRKDKLISLRVDNPSPYYVSFHAIDVVGEKDATRMALGGGMVAPGASAHFTLPPDKRAVRVTKVDFSTINDYGATLPSSATVEP